nr:hypothetical protein [Amycolatopsis sulphurea]
MTGLPHGRPVLPAIAGQPHHRTRIVQRGILRGNPRSIRPRRRVVTAENVDIVLHVILPPRNLREIVFPLPAEHDAHILRGQFRLMRSHRPHTVLHGLKRRYLVIRSRPREREVHTVVRRGSHQRHTGIGQRLIRCGTLPRPTQKSGQIGDPSGARFQIPAEAIRRLMRVTQRSGPGPTGELPVDVCGAQGITGHHHPSRILLSTISAIPRAESQGSFLPIFF